MVDASRSAIHGGALGRLVTSGSAPVVMLSPFSPGLGLASVGAAVLGSATCTSSLGTFRGGAGVCPNHRAPTASGVRTKPLRMKPTFFPRLPQRSRSASKPPPVSQRTTRRTMLRREGESLLMVAACAKRSVFSQRQTDATSAAGGPCAAARPGLQGACANAPGDNFDPLRCVIYWCQPARRHIDALRKICRLYPERDGEPR
jgi:hypothetical protein